MQNVLLFKFLRVVFVVLLVVILSLLFALLLVRLQVFKTQPVYSVIYMDTGEIYFGQFSRFPYPSLENGFVLQRDKDQGVAILPLSATIWQPKGSLKINPTKIVFTAKLSETSSVYRMIKAWEQNKANGSAGSVPNAQPSPSEQPAAQ